MEQLRSTADATKAEKDIVIYRNMGYDVGQVAKAAEIPMVSPRPPFAIRWLFRLRKRMR
jgi:hypothetical protein